MRFSIRGESHKAVSDHKNYPRTLTLTTPTTYIVDYVVLGGTLELLVGIVLYVVVIVSALSFLKLVHRRDEDMRELSAQWIEETSQAEKSGDILAGTHS